MENPGLLPTRWKERISHELSYPIGAERISQALVGLPQYGEFALHFNGDPWNTVRTGRYLILRSSCSTARHRRTDHLIVDRVGVSLHSGRDIMVYAVPRALRHRIQQYILNSALPEMRAWWMSRAGNEYGREDELRFVYDEHTDEFQVEAETRLEPQRA